MFCVFHRRRPASRSWKRHIRKSRRATLVRAPMKQSDLLEATHIEHEGVDDDRQLEGRTVETAGAAVGDRNPQSHDAPARLEWPDRRAARRRQPGKGAS